MKKKLLTLTASLLLSLTPLTAMASKGDQGTDWAVYQGTNGVFGYSSDKFVISQLGGTVHGSIYEQYTYPTQVASAIAAKKRAHTYLWGEFGSSKTQAKAMLDYMLPKVQTPKGSIVAIDYEDGASGDKQANTDTIMYALKRIKNAGYTPILYSGKGYLNAYVNTSSIVKAYGNCLWLAEYPDYSVRTKPNYNWFPSMNGVAIFQFTSTYIAGGLDGNVDLTGITDNGYTHSDNPKTGTPAIKAGKIADNTPKHKIKAGDKVKVKFSAKHWATGESLPSWVTGKTYKVKSVSGSKVLLSGINSWIEKSNVEIIQTVKKISSSNKTYKDGRWTIHAENGTFTANRGLSVWYWPGYSATGARYYSGESVHYYGWVRNGRYVYVAYHASDGLTHYLAVRDNGTALGTFK